jgi:hypothetical protein
MTTKTPQATIPVDTAGKEFMRFGPWIGGQFIQKLWRRQGNCTEIQGGTRLGLPMGQRRWGKKKPASPFKKLLRIK